MARFVEMYHPELGRTARVSERSFDKVWSNKGWVLDATEEAGDDDPVFVPASEVADSSDDELETDD